MRRWMVKLLILPMLLLAMDAVSPAEAQRRGSGQRQAKKNKNQTPPPTVEAPADASQPAGGAAASPAAPPASAPKDTALLAMEPEIWAYAVGAARASLARAADPAGPQALVAEGRVLTLEAKYDDAIGRFDRAATAAPDDPAALVYKGEALLYARQEAAARQAFTEAERRAQRQLERGESADALYHLGVAQQRLGEHDAAFATLDRARAIAPGDERIPYQMGATRFLQQRFQDAVDLTTQALERNPRMAYGYWIRGNAAGQVDRKDLLVNDLRRFVELAPDAPEADRARRILSSVRG